MKKIFVLYDCPIEECDKLWVSEGLQSAGHEVEILDCPYQISHMERNGKLGMLRNRFTLLWQSWKAVRKSSSEDIIFCWQQYEGIFTNFISRGKRNIISYNWLSPRPKKRMKKYYKAALENVRFRAVVNSEKNKEKNLAVYGAEDRNNIFYIPDVYDTNSTFLTPAYKAAQERFCFMGGRENRDWKVFLEMAALAPEISFVGVAASADWDAANVVPANVEMHFDLPAQAYYELVQKAYLAVYLLKEDRVSGLINIVKGIQAGVPVLVTKLSVTEMYYETSIREQLLTPMGDAKAAADRIRDIYQWTEGQYCDIVTGMQRYLKTHFSPDMAVERILEIAQTFQENDV